MRKLFLVLLTLLPSFSIAQTQLAIWTIEHIDYLEPTRIELELEIGKRHFFAYGLILTSDNSGYSAHGSCYNLTSGNVVCELDVRGQTWIMTIGSTLNGTMSIRNSIGGVLDEGSVTLQSVE